MIYTLLLLVIMTDQGTSVEIPLGEYKNLSVCLSDGLAAVDDITRGIPETEDRKLRVECVANFKPKD